MSSRKESPIVILSRALPPGVVAGLVVQVAAIVGGLTLGALALGFFLDAALGTRPLFILALAVISMPVSVWLTYRAAMRASARARAQYQDYLQSRHPPPQEQEPAPGEGARGDSLAPAKR